MHLLEPKEMVRAQKTGQERHPLLQCDSPGVFRTLVCGSVAVGVAVVADLVAARTMTKCLETQVEGSRGRKVPLELATRSLTEEVTFVQLHLEN